MQLAAKSKNWYKGYRDKSIEIESSMKILRARTFMPEIIAPGTGLTPPTEKSVIPTNNVFTIQDVMQGKKYQIPGGGGDWSTQWGEDNGGYFKPEGDDYKREVRDMDIMNKMMTPPVSVHPNYGEQSWEVKVPGGRRIFPSQNLARQFSRKMMEKGIPVDSVSRIKMAQQELKENSEDRVNLVSKAMQKTLMVESLNLLEGEKLNGATFCLAPNYFVTCAHVVQHYDKNKEEQLDLSSIYESIKVYLVRGNEKFPAEVIAMNAPWDIAILKCDLNVEPFALDLEPSVGENILTIGSPHGFENNVSFGNVGGENRRIYNHENAPEYMFVDLAAFTGNSGGPIIKESNGAVIGMLTAIVTASGEFGLNAGLPASYLKEFCSKYFKV